MYGDTDKYGIYQLKDSPGLRDFQFAGTESLKRRGIIKDNFDAIKPENYNLVYVSEIAEALKQRDTHDMALWIAEIAADGTEPEERKRALELLRKLAEYKPLAKIEEIEEQNYNMVDNVLNNGAGEKAQKEENKKEQERPAARTSLKARLAEKKALVSGQGKDHEAQENDKNNQREM